MNLWSHSTTAFSPLLLSAHPLLTSTTFNFYITLSCSKFQKCWRKRWYNWCPPFFQFCTMPCFNRDETSCTKWNDLSCAHVLRSQLLVATSQIKWFTPDKIFIHPTSGSADYSRGCWSMRSRQELPSATAAAATNLSCHLFKAFDFH